MFIFTQLVFTRVFGPPTPYHYKGMFPLRDDNFIMFQPYRQFIVNYSKQYHLCRAYDEPKCTYWNALLISNLNKTHHTQNYWLGLPWTADNMTVVHLDNLKQCVQYCANKDCTALQYRHEYGICAITQSHARIDLSTNMTKKLITQNYSRHQNIVRKNFSINEQQVLTWIQHFIDAAGCRLNKFRCAP